MCACMHTRSVGIIILYNIIIYTLTDASINNYTCRICMIFLVVRKGIKINNDDRA